ncbi:hypothetical protein BWI15_07115 [Kribbella sp. ALI-6-A]|uniref:hypothetical protein n=1 Tax=Kribbella sp. ALI-6-A TaxID=1933817 RepID=UPI00097CA421|nr:hypothetical protein [Kribbella sp. ALI-6-A]ONI75603.1 hypothetical protein BWI15_07115 [Kribbella sp. ALI-6-A]
MTWPTTLRTTAATAALLAGLVITPIALSRLDDNQRLVETQPIREVEVVAVYSPRTIYATMPTVMVRHPDTSVPTAVQGAEKLVTLPASGAYVPVVVDPDDRTNLFLTTVDWSPTWFDYTATTAATALPALTLAALVSGIFTQRRKPVE